jgi:hypothetical protein
MLTSVGSNPTATMRTNATRSRWSGELRNAARHRSGPGDDGRLDGRQQCWLAVVRWLACRLKVAGSHSGRDSFSCQSTRGCSARHEALQLQPSGERTAVGEGEPFE